MRCRLFCAAKVTDMKISNLVRFCMAAVTGALLLSGSAGNARSLFGSRFYAPNGYYRAPAAYGYYAAPQGPYNGYGFTTAAALNRYSAPNYDAAGRAAQDYLPSVCHEGTYTWEANKMPIKVYVSDGRGVPGYRPQFGQFIRHAFDEWTAHSQNKLAWVEVQDPNQADVTVTWTNKITERPEGTEAGKTDAYTRYNRVTGKGIIYGAKMQFLTRLPEREFSDNEVEKTCLHEAGHAFGLQGHSPYPDDIMYYAIQQRQHAELTDRDVNTMNKLYAAFPTLDAVALGSKTQSNAAARQ
jgi:hypothetical protein